MPVSIKSLANTGHGTDSLNFDFPFILRPANAGGAETNTVSNANKIW